jgi:hypothetical protein
MRNDLPLKKFARAVNLLRARFVKSPEAGRKALPHG